MMKLFLIAAVVANVTAMMSLPTPAEIALSFPEGSVSDGVARDGSDQTIISRRGTYIRAKYVKCTGDRCLSVLQTSPN